MNKDIRIRIKIALVTVVITGCAVPHSRPLSLETRHQLIHDDQELPMHWDPHRFPLRVYLNNLPKPKVRSALLAIQWWNIIVQEEVFTAVAKNYDIDITSDMSMGIIECRADPQNAFLGTTQMDAHIGYMQGASITIAYNMPGALEEAVLVHELGHALGLAHDPENKLSLMNPTIWSPWMQMVQEEDVAAVKEELRR